MRLRLNVKVVLDDQLYLMSREWRIQRFQQSLEQAGSFLVGEGEGNMWVSKVKLVCMNCSLKLVKPFFYQENDKSKECI